MTEAKAETPRRHRGAVILEWPKPAPNGVGALIGNLVTVYDPFTGAEPGPKLITTVSEISLRVTMGEFVTADLTMFADADGNPVYDGKPHIRDGEIVTGTFPFIVSEMRVRS
jgi:hypothetical protein